MIDCIIVMKQSRVSSNKLKWYPRVAFDTAVARVLHHAGFWTHLISSFRQLLEDSFPLSDSKILLMPVNIGRVKFSSNSTWCPFRFSSSCKFIIERFWFNFSYTGFHSSIYNGPLRTFSGLTWTFHSFNGITEQIMPPLKCWHATCFIFWSFFKYFSSSSSWYLNSSTGITDSVSYCRPIQSILMRKFSSFHSKHGVQNRDIVIAWRRQVGMWMRWARVRARARVGWLSRWLIHSSSWMMQW